MELNTVQIIDRICKLDTNVHAIVVLKLTESVSWLYDNVEDDNELDRCIEEVLNRKIVSVSSLLHYIFGYEISDDNTHEIIEEYYASNSSDRMDILKKRLIISAIELEKDRLIN